MISFLTIAKAIVGVVAALQANALQRLLPNGASRTEVAGNCRRVTMTEYRLSVEAPRRLELYDQLTGAHAVPHAAGVPG